VFSVHTTSILHGVLVGPGSFWPTRDAFTLYLLKAKMVVLYIKGTLLCAFGYRDTLVGQLLILYWLLLLLLHKVLLPK
jgi:hypothetical protein